MSASSRRRRRAVTNISPVRQGVLFWHRESPVPIPGLTCRSLDLVCRPFAMLVVQKQVLVERGKDGFRKRSVVASLLPIGDEIALPLDVARTFDSIFQCGADRGQHIRSAHYRLGPSFQILPTLGQLVAAGNTFLRLGEPEFRAGQPRMAHGTLLRNCAL